MPKLWRFRNADDRGCNASYGILSVNKVFLVGSFDVGVDLVDLLPSFALNIF